MKRSVIAILTATVILLSLLGPILFQTAQAADPSEWYKTVAGVLDSDYYSLYPFKTDKSLKIGFSKFGEMIDSSTNVGLEYRSRDAFAPPAGASVPPEIVKKKWMSGWLINITYRATTGMRNVWAMAQHADLTDYGKDWIRVDSSYLYAGALTEATEDPKDVGKLIGTGVGPVNGGRKTNGTATTEDIMVLYDGPRMFIGRTVTHIFDWDAGWTEDEPLVDIVFTIIFNKVKKQVIVLKDIKEATTKFVFGQVEVPIGEGANATVNGAIIQFSNRGEWDIGPADTYDSYVHFYTAGNGEPQSTVYNSHYHLNPTLYPAPWLGISSHGPEPKTAGTYDVAQVLASDRAYVGWAAFWPSLSNWHVDAGYQDEWWRSLDQGDDAADTGIEPFMSPYIIGEWDFVLTKTNTTYFDRQFRGVTVYGLTDQWNGDDANRSGGNNVLDREVEYQLDEVFNPWDLVQAVHKKEKRWVDFHTVTTAEKTAADVGTNLVFTLTHTPVKYASVWEQYCEFSERVEWGGAMKHPGRSVWVYPATTLSASEPYELSVTAATGVGTITIRAASVPAAGTKIKILYSTYTEYSNWGDIDKTWTDGDIEWAASVPISKSYTYTIIDPLGANHTLDILDLGFTVSNLTALAEDQTYEFIGTMDFYEEDFKVFKEGSTLINCYWWDQAGPSGGRVFRHVDDDGTIQVNFTNFWMQWYITPPTHEDLHVDWLHLDVDYNITVFYNATSLNYTITTNFNVNGAGGYNLPGCTGTWTDQLYVEHVPGRYEWVVVGNHSRTIDSVGSAMVSAAFKNKQVEIGNGGLDMKDMWGVNVPYLLSDFGYTSWRGGPAWTDIYDSIGRLALVDDWCTRYPVSTSNIITVAGPSANLVSEYFNEFSQAIQIYGGIPDILLSDVIFATTCWNTTKASNYLGQYYYSNGQFTQGATGTGIGVITTYKDINGTVGFLIHGWSGDDTYYTCKWFHETGIYHLQTENPGVTTLIVRLDYNLYPHNPTVTILERLGTISEKTPHDP